jgi:hypothetical protein
MGTRARLLAAGLAALAPACAGPPEEPVPDTPPHFARAYGAWRPEELDHDVTQCARDAAERVAARRDVRADRPNALRRAFREATAECMRRRGWLVVR